MESPVPPTESMRFKYQSRNPIVRRMVDSFLCNLDELVTGVPAGSLLEVGCGEGYLTQRMQQLRPRTFVCGSDASQAMMEIAQERFGSVPFFRGTIYQLPCRERAFDLVVACEVLEHLTAPEEALDELRRVAGKHVILSVPREPIWRLLNMARGQYLSDWGNTPGHLQHWRPAAFIRLVSRYFEVREVRRPFPWTMLLVAQR